MSNGKGSPCGAPAMVAAELHYPATGNALYLRQDAVYGWWGNPQLRAAVASEPRAQAVVPNLRQKLSS
jgi:hypothetical protein